MIAGHRTRRARIQAGPGADRTPAQLAAQYLDFSPNFVTRNRVRQPRGLRSANTESELLLAAGRKVPELLRTDVAAFSIFDHSGTPLEYFFYPGFRVRHGQRHVDQLPSFGYDDVCLRPIDYSTLDHVAAYPQPFWGFEAGTSWFKEIDLSAFFVSGKGVNYNPVAGRIR